MTTTTSQVLNHLEAWVLPIPSEEPDEDPIEPIEGEEPLPEEEEVIPEPTDYGEIYTITEQEINTMITSATIQATSYLQLKKTTDIPNSPLIDEAIAIWTAGLLWNKKEYNDAPADAGNAIRKTFGDTKIQEAKDILKGAFIGDKNNDGRPDDLIIASTYTLG